MLMASEALHQVDPDNGDTEPQYNDQVLKMASVPGKALPSRFCITT